jgi:hypothetical protein
MRRSCFAFALVFAACGPAAADSIFDNLNVIRMSPPLAYYTPGTIARGYLDKRTWQRTGDRLLKVNLVRCRAKFDEDGFSQVVDGVGFTSHDQKSFGLSAGWANILNASFKGQYVSGVNLTFTGTIYEYDESKLETLRRRCLGSANPKADTNPNQFQIVRLAVGKFEYSIQFAGDANASLKADIVNKFAGELGVNGGVDKKGTVTIPNGAMALPLWRRDW